MPQVRPPSYPGGIYHLYNRGAHRLSIFREPENYIYILQKIKHYIAELNLTILAYCLMPNHYHFLIRQNSEMNAGMLAQRIFNSYSKAYNKRYNHSGTLFQGPYRIKRVVQTPHLLQLCRYIHANPVKDGLVNKLEDWPYSNYLEWINQRPGTLIDREFVDIHFINAQAYKEFVLDYLQTRQLPADVVQYLRQIEY